MPQHSQWIIDVIYDLCNFAQGHEYAKLPEVLSDAQILAHIELEAEQKSMQNGGLRQSPSMQYVKASGD